MDTTPKEVVLVAMRVLDPATMDIERLRDRFSPVTTTGLTGKCNHLSATVKVQGMNCERGNENYAHVYKYETCFQFCMVFVCFTVFFGYNQPICHLNICISYSFPQRTIVLLSFLAMHITLLCA